MVLRLLKRVQSGDRGVNPVLQQGNGTTNASGKGDSRPVNPEKGTLADKRAVCHSIQTEGPGARGYRL